ncbi:MAG: glycosyltransferase family 39 protein [Candidatus Bathyarchaeia archaeon]
MPKVDTHFNTSRRKLEGVPLEKGESVREELNACLASAYAVLYRRRFQAVFLIGLWLFQSASLAFWENQNRELLAFDEVGHFLASVVVLKILHSPWSVLDLPRFLNGLPNGLGAWVLFNFTIFPPLVYVVTAILYFFAPSSLPMAALTNAIFLLILLVSVYGIGDELLGPTAGVVAAFLASTYPLLVGLTRLYLLDFPLTAMVALSLFLLIKTREFRDRKMVILFSVSLVLGMLTRHPFPLYVLGPFLYVVARGCRIRISRNNILFCVAIVSTSILYYIIKPGGLGAYNWYAQYTHLEGLSFSTPAYIAALIYLKVMAQGMSYFLFLLFAVGFILFVRFERASRFFILVAVITPLLLLGVIYPAYYDPRFVAPILPIAAVVSSQLFKRINSKNRAHLLALTIVGLFVISQFASITYNIPALNGIYTEGRNAAPGAYPPIASNWRIPEILQAVEKDAISQKDETPIVVALSIDYYFDQTLFEYYAYVEGIPAIVPPNYGQFSTTEGVTIVNSANYVVTRSNPANWSGPIVFVQNLIGVSKYVQSHPESFVLLSNYTLPDSSVASLYRRVAPVLSPDFYSSPAQTGTRSSDRDSSSSIILNETLLDAHSQARERIASLVFYRCSHNQVPLPQPV